MKPKQRFDSDKSIDEFVHIVVYLTSFGISCSMENSVFNFMLRF